MLQSREYDLFTRLFNLAGQKHLVQYRIHLVKIEDQIQLADITEELV